MRNIAASPRSTAATRRLADMPAFSLEGLIFKARWVESGDDELKDSIVADLLAMA